MDKHFFFFFLSYINAYITNTTAKYKKKKKKKEKGMDKLFFLILQLYKCIITNTSAIRQQAAHTSTIS